MKLAELLGLIKGERDSIREIDAKLRTLVDQLGQVRAAPPDRATVVSWALRSVDTAVAAFEKNLSGWYFLPEHVAAVPAEWYESDSGPSWLQSQQRCPGAGFSEAIMDAQGLPRVDHQVLVFLLAPTLRAALPEIIDKHFTFSPAAISTEERTKKVAKLEKQIADLQAQREQLAQALNEVRGELDGALPPE